MTCPLSPRQLECLTLVGEMTYQQAAQQLGIGFTTFRTHIAEACHKLNTPTSAQAYLACVRAGWIAFDQGNEANQQFEFEKLLTRIAEAIERRQEKGLTLTQRRWIDTFEEYLRRPASPAEWALPENRLSVATGALCAEAGVKLDARRFVRRGVRR